MPDYQKMYHSLFNSITDAIHILQSAQQQTEERYAADAYEEDVLPFPVPFEK